MDEGPVETTRSGGRLRVYVGVVIVVAVIAYLVVSGLRGATAPYLTVAQAKAQPGDGQGRLVRVTGIVLGETIRFDAESPLLQFDLSGQGQSLAVRYVGAKPDMMRDGADCSVEGRLGTDGVFLASQLFLKCPSKYEAKATDEAST